MLNRNPDELGIPRWGDGGSRPGAVHHGAHLGGLQVDEQQVVAERECAVKAHHREPAGVGGEALDAVPTTLDDAPDRAILAVEHVDVDVDTVSLRRAECDELPIATDVTEIVLDVLFDNKARGSPPFRFTSQSW